jgi:hypothetical protein
MTIFWESLARLMLTMEMIGVDENDNKPEHEDASHGNVDDFKDTCEVCLCDVENVVHSTENNIEVQELFEDDRN